MHNHNRLTIFCCSVALPLLALTLVPAQAAIDNTAPFVLNTNGAVGKGTSVDAGLSTFYVVQGGHNGTGSGAFNTFLKFQSPQNSTSAQGFNTKDINGNNNLILDDKTGTTGLQLSQIVTVAIDGQDYRVFALDVGNPGGSTISINQIQIFTSDHPWSTDTSPTADTFSPTNPAASPYLVALNSGFSEVFRLRDGSTSNEIQLTVPAGNGKSDMLLFVSNSIFGMLPDTTYITMYSQLGLPPGAFQDTGSFNEWASVTDAMGLDIPSEEPLPGTVPEPMSLAVWGLGGFCCAIAGYRRRKLA